MVIIMKAIYNKLVRDLIPEIIESSGKTCMSEILSDDDYLKMLDAKLDEERNQLIVDIWLNYVRDKRTVVFCASVKHAELITGLFQDDVFPEPIYKHC